jgi:hypothetical protein
MSESDEAALTKSKVFSARKGTSSMKGTIPSDVVSGLKLADGDELEWELLPEGSKIIAKVRKAE